MITPTIRPRPFCAVVSHPNTPESDRQRTVEHDVTVDLGNGVTEVVRLQATDPMNAIDLVRLMDPAIYARLPRVRTP